MIVREDATVIRRRSPSQRRHKTQSGKRPDPKKSRLARQRWRKGKAKLLKGIRKFNRSARGRQFHKKLGRFNARDTRSLVASVREDMSGWSALIETWDRLAEQLTSMSLDHPEILPLASLVRDILAGVRDEAQYRDEPESDDWSYLSEVHADLLQALRTDTPEEMIEAIRSGCEPRLVLLGAVSHG